MVCFAFDIKIALTFLLKPVRLLLGCISGKKGTIELFIIILTLSFRLLWNHGATILSLAINLFMLVTWNAKASREDFDKHNNTLTNQTLDRALLQE